MICRGASCTLWCRTPMLNLPPLACKSDGTGRSQFVQIIVGQAHGFTVSSSVWGATSSDQAMISAIVPPMFNFNPALMGTAF
jgi:hypothetical protein